MVKALCSICNREGHLQVRGKSARIGHYLGYKGSTRIIEWHKVNMVNNGNQKMVNNKSDLAFFNQNRRGPVVQLGTNAAFAMRRSRVQIPPGPLLRLESHLDVSPEEIENLKSDESSIFFQCPRTKPESALQRS